MIAYFSAELAIDQELHIYAGGLGVVAGSFLRAAGNLNLPIVGVSLLWTEGYYDQEVCQNDNNLSMQIKYNRRYYNDILIDTGLLLSTKIAGSDVKIKVLEIPKERYGICPTYLLNVDIPENNANPLAQLITRNLYGGNEDRRLAQKIILKCGIEALEKLKYKIDIYHLNEAFCMLVGLEIFRRELEKGYNFEEALKETKKKIVFSTHTPDKAGNEIHSIADMYRMGCCLGLPEEYIVRLGQGNGLFNATAACLKMARKANGVSRLHTKIAQRMWHWVEDASPIISITNGVDVDFWQYNEFRGDLTIEEIQKAKLKYKRKMLGYIASITGKFLSENVLTIVWARRFAEYKRPQLIFFDRQKLISLLSANRIQLVLAGKPHPRDRDMINLWNGILNKEIPNLVIIPGYELELSKILKAGSDVWLNTPRRPQEACGTSWMSAAMNGAVNLSSRDGGAIEGIIDGESGFLFGVDKEEQKYNQDAEDAKNLYEVLYKIIDIFQNDKRHWYNIALKGKEIAEKQFSAKRMIKEYFEKMYQF